MENSIPQTRDDISYIDEIVALMTKKRQLEEACQDSQNFETCDDVQKQIDELPLSVCVMCLHPTSVGTEMRPDHYELLLGTGGPAWRVYGELDQYCQVNYVQLQFQDWGTPWIDVTHLLTQAECDALLAFAHNFYYGE